jgi:NADPH:quinone reductase-like Zn-dependent oxidoreductase
MHAVRIHRYGGTDVLQYEEAPRPTPGPGEVLIRILATTVNPFDCAVRAGYMTAYFSHTLPLILGTDVSGIVEELGPGVTSPAVRQSVYTRTGVFRDGSYAEYAVAPAADTVVKPISLDHTHTAAIPHALLTAWQGLYEIAQLARGQTVLIQGAGGGVGHLAVQLAKLRGATVIGTGSINIDFVRSLGVDQAVNYATTRLEDAVRDVDVVLDLVGGEVQDRSWSVLRPGGILVSTVQPPSEERAREHGVRQAMVATAPPIGPVLTEVAALVDAGKLRPEVSQVLPLSEIRTAHELIEGRHTRGKIVLQVMS